MASDTELTPTSYINHHLTNLTAQVSEGSFWVLHVDTLVTSLILGVISFGRSARSRISSWDDAGAAATSRSVSIIH